MKSEKKWPLLIAIPIWIGGAVLAFFGYWWPLIIMTGIAALIGVSSIGMFLYMRFASQAVRTVAEATMATPHKVTGAGRGKGKKR